MRQSIPTFRQRLERLPAAALLAAGIAALVAGCTMAPVPAPVPPAPPTPAPVPPVVTPAPSGVRPSAATTRRDAASHLYGLNSQRIYKGRLPPLLHAVGVLQVDLDRQGRVLSTHWLRAPRHAPEVMAEIERTVRQAAPFPAPARLGRVTYTDTWLWHQSGRFQLDTLTEGQD
jgi:periplasmic protein TonB